MRRPALIDGWQRCLRLNTVQACIALAVLSLLDAQLLPLLTVDFPSRAWPYVSLGFAVGIAVLRLRAQPGALEAPAAAAHPAATTPESIDPLER